MDNMRIIVNAQKRSDGSNTFDVQELIEVDGNAMPGYLAQREMPSNHVAAMMVAYAKGIEQSVMESQ